MAKGSAPRPIAFLLSQLGSLPSLWVLQSPPLQMLCSQTLISLQSISGPLLLCSWAYTPSSGNSDLYCSSTHTHPHSSNSRRPRAGLSWATPSHIVSSRITKGYPMGSNHRVILLTHQIHRALQLPLMEGWDVDICGEAEMCSRLGTGVSKDLCLVGAARTLCLGE